MNNSTTRFSDRVTNYTKYRPSYPLEAITYLCSEFAITPTSVVADIGSGTGIFTKQILPFVGNVFAVEPNSEMRAAAESLLGTEPGFRSIVGTSENTTLPGQSVGFIFAAQAFHWFDLPRTKVEFQRILTPNGVVSLLWNKRQLNSDFLVLYEELVKSIPGYSEVTHHNITQDILRNFLGTEYQLKVFENSQLFDFEGLLGRFSSSSYTPKEGTEEYRKVRRELESIFERTAENGTVAFTYETEVHSGKIT